jgi:O-antigen/teichoic acid export membrane protein
MYKPLSLRKNFLWTFAGNTVNSAALWGIVAVLAKLGSPDVVGRLELGRAITLPILAIVMLNLSVVLVTDAREQYAFEDYFGARVVTTVLGFVVICIIGLGWYGGEIGWIVVLWGLAKSVDSVSDIIRGFFQRYERMNLSSVSMVLKSVSALFIIAAIIWYSGNLLIALGATAAVWFLVLLVWDLPQAHRLLSMKSAVTGVRYRLRPRFHIKTIVPLLRLAFPLGIITFLLALQGSVPRGVLEAYYNTATLGYFGSIAYPIALGAIVVDALGQSASPRLANYYIADIRQYQRLVRKLLWLAVIMGIVFVAGVLLMGKPLLRFLYTADYAGYQREFVILTIGAAIGFVSSFCGYSITAARAFRTAMLLKVMTCATVVPVSFLLIPSYGIRGAALTSVVVFGVGLVTSFTALVWIIRARKREVAMAQVEPSSSH